MTVLDNAAREQLKAKLWTGVDRQTGGSDRKRFWKMVGGIAAAVTFMLVSVLLMSRNFRGNTQMLGQNGMLEVENTSASVQKVALVDGSVVSLEPGSTLRYPEHFGAQRSISYR